MQYESSILIDAIIAPAFTDLTRTLLVAASPSQAHRHESRIKQFKTSRGINHSYYFASAAAGKPYLFLPQGFPCRQIACLEPLGFSLFVPDLVGHGHTDKPIDLKRYLGVAMLGIYSISWTTRRWTRSSR